jgi:hypothetical protein
MLMLLRESMLMLLQEDRGFEGIFCIDTQLPFVRDEGLATITHFIKSLSIGSMCSFYGTIIDFYLVVLLDDI